MTHLLFDYDGTLHESLCIYAPAFRRSQQYLISHQLIGDRMYSDQEISHWIGYPVRKMWEEFAPDLSEEEKQIGSKIIGDEMVRLTNEGQAKLYAHVPLVLSQLKTRGYNLIFLSHCKTSYMKAHIHAFHLNQYFSAFYCSEAYGFIPKFEIFNGISVEHPGEFIVIGDKMQDIEVAKHHGLKSIGCAYGYGSENELSEADQLVKSVSELLDILK